MYYLKKIYFLFWGWFVAKRILRKHNDYIIFSTYTGVGDRVFLLAYIEEYKKLYDKNIKIISCNTENPVYNIFGISESELVKVAKKDVIALNEFYKTDIGNRFRRMHPRLLSVTVDAYVRTDLIDYRDFVYYSDVVKAILKIPKDYIPKRIDSFQLSANCQRQICEAEIRTNGMVLLNPYSNSCNYIALSFFQTIADRLIENGYTVITSIYENQECLKGSFGLRFGLEDAIPLANHCKIVIGARSGFMDLISFSGTPIICVDNVLYQHNYLFCLEKCWKDNSKIFTVHWDRNAEGRSINEVYRLVEILGGREKAEIN